MYKDRNPQPHQLSYSSVSNYTLTNPNLSNQSGRYQFAQSSKQPSYNSRASLKNNNNNDCPYLRNTMGPKYLTNFDQQLLKSEEKLFDSSLRQTTGSLLDIREKLKLTTNQDTKRASITVTRLDMSYVGKNQKKQPEEGNRLQKIMDKYEKKNQTKQALKLLEELKELKKRQQQLKKQRKNQSKTQQQPINKTTNFDCNSPINFNKKNKVQYFTPTAEKKQLSTNHVSPQHNSYESSKNNSYNISNKLPISTPRPIQKQTSNILNELDRSRSRSPNTLTCKTNYQNKQQFCKTYSSYSSVNTAKYQNERSFNPTSKYDLSKNSNMLNMTNSNYNSNSNKSTQPFYRIDKQPYNSPAMSKKNQPYEQFNASVLNTTKDTTSTQRDISKSPNSQTILTSNPSSLKYNTNLLASKKYTQIISTPSKTKTISQTATNSMVSLSFIKESFERRNVTINDFIIGKNLGEGKFGVVYQAFDKKSKNIYALKKVPKSTIKSHWMIDQFILQVKLQAYLNHPNILGLIHTFDDLDHVYILLEYMQEGTLFLQLKKNQILNEKQAAIKLKQISAAVQYLHENNIAHRDIKPENIVMSHGVCKLCDFGWATICDERRKTYCGTFDYAAPEILEGTEYDFSVDLWCLGILAYEILVGKAPFYHISRKQTMKKIINVEKQKINYPSTMSRQARSFIEQLLRKNPEERLKSEDLLNHPFLKNVQK